MMRPMIITDNLINGILADRKAGAKCADLCFKRPGGGQYGSC